MAEIVFRADASQEIGTGHVMRCLTLARALRAAGHAVRFITRNLPGHLAAWIEGAGIAVDLLPAPDPAFAPAADDPAHARWAGVGWARDAGEVAALLAGHNADWLVLDHYAFDARWEETVQTEVGRIMVWDDLADRPHACALLLDQNLGRSAESYAGLVPDDAVVLTGPAYAVLRPAFADLREEALRARQGRGLTRILVSMGGVDLPNATGAVLDVLARVPGLHHVAVDVVLGGSAPALAEVRARAATMPMPVSVAIDVDDMADRMARADLAIGAVGGTTWERCALGLPSLLLTIAANQRPAAEALDATGAARLLGDFSQPDWRGHLAAFLTDPERDAQLPRMAAAAAAICDGGGAKRVLAALLRPRARFRDAAEADTRRVYDWRYGAGPDPFAQNAGVPAFADHAGWFARALASQDRHIRILEADRTPMGYIRLDLADGRGTVSLCLAPEARGQGWGRVLLDEAQRMGRGLGLAVLDATVHGDNRASLRLFAAAGYVPDRREGAFRVFCRQIGGPP